MVNGFNVNVSEFEQLPQKQKMTALFHNTDTIIKKMEEYKSNLKNHERDDNFHHKIQYWLIAIMASLFGVGKFFKII